MPSYIELDKNASLPTPSNEGRVVLGVNTSGTMTMTDTTGNVNEIGGITSKTYSEMQDLISSESLNVGAFYRITDADSNNGLYGGTEVIVQAIDVNTLGSRGYGKFFNPQYDQTTTGFGVWTDLIKFQTFNLSGSFDYNEDYYGNGTLLGVDPLDINQHIVFDTDFDGGYNFLRPDDYTDDWSVVTSLTGSNSGATIQVTNLTVPSYASGSTVIWGGSVWVNKTGDVGHQNGMFELDTTNWELVEYNTTDYNISWDEIEYDFANDFITMRKDIAGNIVEQSYNDWLDWDWYRAIKVFQWGNQYNEDENCGMGQNRINNSMCFTINFRGRNFRNNEIKNYSSFGEDCYYEDDVRIAENVMNDSGLYETFFSGDNCNFRNNVINNTWIDYNYFAGYVDFRDNTFTDSGIYNNSFVYADVENNVLTNSSMYDTYIQYGCNVSNNLLHNSNIGGGGGSNYLTYYCSISNNTLLNNCNISGINSTNSSNIQYNHLAGQSSINTVTADNGSIQYNSLSNYSLIYSNMVKNSSAINYNALTNESEIYNNIIVSSSQINDNSMSTSYIYNINTISASISVNSNTLNNASEISNNIMDNGTSISNCALFNNYYLQNQTTTVSNQFYANI